MFCEVCGTKNAKGAQFCEKCGHKMAENEKIKDSSKVSKAKNKMNSLPKKTKYLMGGVLLLVIIAVIVLAILLNNPVKKVEDYLVSYYDNYSEDNKEELIEIGKILKDNKNDKDILNDIKTSVHNATNKWTKNFNREYKSIEELNNTYDKVKGALKDIYTYFEGLEYMLDYELYNKYYGEINTLYYSKKAYLEAVNYEKDNDSYYAYYNYQKVIEEDNYYDEAQKYIKEYVKEEMATIKEQAEKIVNLDKDATNEQILNAYIEQVKFLNNNKTVNNIDLSSTEEYKNMYDGALKKIVETANKYGEELAQSLNYVKIIEKIDEALKVINQNSAEYKELETLKAKYENMLPDSLFDKYNVSSSSGVRETDYKKEIAGKEYSSSLSFEFRGETIAKTYRLNTEYKKFKTTIVRGEDWDKDFNGYFVIYGDDKELYKSDIITKASELKPDIELDVTGVDDLKIEFVTTSEPEGWTNFYIYLVEPYLYK